MANPSILNKRDIPVPHASAGTVRRIRYEGGLGPKDAAPVVHITPFTPGQILVSAVLVVLVVAVIYGAIKDPKLDWSIVMHYLFSDTVLSGVLVTLELTILCQALGIVIGAGVAAMGQSRMIPLRAAASLYIFLFRGTPLVVQLIFWFNIAGIVPAVHLPVVGTLDLNRLIGPFTAAVFGFAFHEAALMAEIIRGGVGAIGRGQRDAGMMIGMTRLQIQWHIVVPQVARIILPATVNDLINLLKATSLVAFIAGGDLMTNVSEIYSRNFQVIPLLIVACLWYLLCVSVFSVVQAYVERALKVG